MESSPEASATKTAGHAATTCTHCGSTTANRLFLRAGDAIQCEPCLLDRCLEPNAGTLAIDRLYGRFVEALIETLDIREMETGLHSRRVACHTLVLARRLVTDPARLRQIYWGALLHDIGKIGIPDHILLKHGELNDEEWVLMRTHVELGYHIVSQLPGLDLASAMVRCHEERYDGTGYPRGLRGEEIPLEARLFAVIDTLDAMTSDRTYRKALSFDTARQEILRMSGTQFSPEAVEVFIAEEAVLRQMVDLKCNAVALD